jgi:voltage-gated potassium channel
MPRDETQVRHGAVPSARGATGAVRGPARRYVVLALARSCVVTTAIFFAYFSLPLTLSLDGGASLVLLAGLLVVCALLVWQLRGVVRSAYPVVRTITALVTALPLFLVVFATTYYVSGVSGSREWSEQLSRLDALYFTVTVFSTVGFGDIVPVSGLARLLTMTQMIADVILVGFVAKAMVAAMRKGIERRGTAP